MHRAEPGPIATLTKRAVLPLRHVLGYRATQLIIDALGVREA